MSEEHEGQKHAASNQTLSPGEVMPGLSRNCSTQLRDNRCKPSARNADSSSAAPISTDTVTPNYLSENLSASTLLLTQGAITNIMRTRLHLAVVCFLIAAVVVAVAELRSPTPAEKAALDKYLAALNPVLDQFQGDDWDENVEYSLDDPPGEH